jgi:hypothetical protein
MKMKKIKLHYRYTIEEFHFLGSCHVSKNYKILKNQCHKHFSVLNEAKQAFTEKDDEYKELYKIRGKRSRRGLPNSWDDYPSYCIDLAKSWKHNSRRKNQWYKEKESILI